MATAAAIKEGADLANLGIQALGKVSEAVKGLGEAKVQGDWEENRLSGDMAHLRALSARLQTAILAHTRPTRADEDAKKQLTFLRDGVKQVMQKLNECLGSRQPEPSKGFRACCLRWLCAAKRQAFGSKTQMHLTQAEKMVTDLRQNFEQLGKLPVADGRIPVGVTWPPRPPLYQKHEAFDMVCALLVPLEAHLDVTNKRTSKQ